MTDGQKKTSDFNVLFNNTVNCYDYTARETDERMRVEHWWKGTYRGKPQYSDRNLS